MKTKGREQEPLKGKLGRDYMYGGGVCVCVGEVARDRLG